MLRKGYIALVYVYSWVLREKGWGWYDYANQIFETKKDLHSPFTATLLSSFPDWLVGPGRGEGMSKGNVLFFFPRPAPYLFCSSLGPLHVSPPLLEHTAFPQS